MKRTIFKHKLDYPETRLMLPDMAKILSVGSQGDDLVLWESHRVGAEPDRERVFKTVMTGEERDINSWDTYLGTTQTASGLVFHIFQENE